MVTLKMFILGAVATVAASATAPLKWRALPAADKGLYTYDHFVLEFGKERSSASEAIFKAKLAEVHAHNAKGATWTMGVNQFTDMSETEFAKYKGKVFDGSDPAAATHFDGPALGDLPSSIDWRAKGAVTPVKNQGGCGSCWAFSSTESVESAVFMATGTLPVLAPQEFVDCIPNPNQCGGTGGCAGSTEEYGFAYAMLYGVAAESAYPYTATTGKTCLLNQAGRVPIAGVSNFVKLPANDAVALMQALATTGPVSISVDASWGGYEKGVYQGCANKTTIDHAVQAVGYGNEDGVDYWLVRNSWGTTWGEEGYIKLPRSTAPVCAMDTSPGSGNGCKSGTPKQQKVCGPCGMLSDSSFPTGGYLTAQK